MVKRAYPKLRLLTDTYILQENCPRFNQYAINDRCLLCEAGAKTRTHFIAVCSRLASVMMSYKEQLSVILCPPLPPKKNPIVTVDFIFSDSNKFVELVLDCSAAISDRLIYTVDAMVFEIERLSRNLCYSLPCLGWVV